MENECLKVIAWLEDSGYMPDEASENLEGAKAHIADAIRDFLAGARELQSSDYDNPKVFRSRLIMMESRARSLRVALENLEEALRKTIIALPEDVFSD